MRLEGDPFGDSPRAYAVGQVVRCEAGLCVVLAEDRDAGTLQVGSISAADEADEWVFGEDAVPLDESLTDARITSGAEALAYSGTFRWQDEHHCTAFPACPARLPRLWPLCRGWAHYLTLRLTAGDGAALSGARLLVHPAVVDALSFPLSVLRALLLVAPGADCPDTAARLLARPCGAVDGAHRRRHLRIILLGAAARAEQSLLACRPPYWAEVAHMCPSVDIELVADSAPAPGGRKKSRARARKATVAAAERRRAEAGRQGSEPGFVEPCFRGTWREYREAACGSGPAGTVLVGVNTGFGSGNPRLMAEWVGDVLDLVAFGAPAAFTCANDHSDVRGEVAVLTQIAGARFVAAPHRNPFAAASTFISEQEPSGGGGGGDGGGGGGGAGPEGGGWSSANAFMYAVKGFEGAGPRVPADEARALVRAILALCAQWGTIGGAPVAP